MGQMALPLKLADYATFSSFADRGNEEVAAVLAGIAGGSTGNAYVWGAPATGKSHLLQAVCATAGDRSVYVPLAELAPAGPAVIDWSQPFG